MVEQPTAKKRSRYRSWVIVCKGVGPINATNFVTRWQATATKAAHWPDNDLYQVQRVYIKLDPPKRNRT